MEVISSDVIRGHIDAIVLSTLMLSDKYGVEIRRAVSEKTNGLYVPNEQSLYSAFHRLERDGFIAGRWGQNDGAKRKYYTITDDGKAYLKSMKADWENTKVLIGLLTNEV
jgi:DNA-binding PadR family transcriptional regulator